MSAPRKPAAAKRRSPASSDHEHVDRISTQTTLLVLFAIAVVLYEIQLMLPPFVAAAWLAYISTPAIEHLTARTGWPRPLFAVAAFAVFLLLGAGLGYLALPPLLREVARTLNDLEGMLRELARQVVGPGKVGILGHPTDAAQLAQATADALRRWLGRPGALAAFGTGAFAAAFGLLLTLVLLFYFLLTGPAIARGLLRLVPPRQRPLIRHIWSLLDPVLKRYFLGVLLVVAYAAAAAYVGLGLVLGIPHAVVLALFTGILEMIPVIGPGAAAVIAGLVAMHHAAGIGPIIAYAIYATALRLSIDQLFGPLALGAAARLHPALVIFCFLAGGLLFGVVGIVLSVPVALVVKVTLALLYDEAAGEPTPRA